MAGVKRKLQSNSDSHTGGVSLKQHKHPALTDSTRKTRPKAKPTFKDDGGTDSSISAGEDEDLMSSTEDLSGAGSRGEDDLAWSGFDSDESEDIAERKSQITNNGGGPAKRAKRQDEQSGDSGHEILTSREAHAKQKTLAKERRAAKPNANEIEQLKRIWDTLRLKTGVAKEERIRLVDQLIEVARGKMSDFVFRHDVVRPIQCAVKYGSAQQRKIIASELKGHYRALAESRYGKFLVAKILVEGDSETRNEVLSEFYGHVRRLINHPEASWILDDAYRQLASTQQKHIMLREWYGPEFAIFKDTGGSPTSDLRAILEESPEKRAPIMRTLFQLIDRIVQKKLTGFTMLHDAMLQYLNNAKPGSDEMNEFYELVRGDEEGDLLRNLAFTKSGSDIVCKALANGSAKDRKNIIRVFKGHMDTLAFDANGHMVLVVGLAFTDDTKMTGKSILSEVLAGSSAAAAGGALSSTKDGKTQNHDNPSEDDIEGVVRIATHAKARVVILYPFCGYTKWLFPTHQQDYMSDLLSIRETTSKKDPTVRCRELSEPLIKLFLSTICQRAKQLAETSFGCQFITEILLATVPAGDALVLRDQAMVEVASLVEGDPAEESHLSHSSHVGRMLKTLVQGGRFDAATQKVIPSEPPSTFASDLFRHIKDFAVDWAVGASPFVIVNLLQTASNSQGDILPGLIRILQAGRKRIEREAKKVPETNGKVGSKKGRNEGSGAKAVLQALDEAT